MILSVLQKLKCEAVGEVPRAIVLVENKEKVQETYDAFFKYLRYHSLRVYLCDEKQHIDLLKSEIFEGADILISTPYTIDKLFSLNGLNATQLKIICIDDADFLTQNSAYTTMMSITQSINKCQFVLYSEKMHPALKRFESYFMQYAKKVSV